MTDGQSLQSSSAIPTVHEEHTEVIKVDYGFTQGKPRQYNDNPTTLKRLGIEKFDETNKIVELKLTLKKANN